MIIVDRTANIDFSWVYSVCLPTCVCLCPAVSVQQSGSLSVVALHTHGIISVYGSCDCGCIRSARRHARLFVVRAVADYQCQRNDQQADENLDEKSS